MQSVPATAGSSRQSRRHAGSTARYMGAMCIAMLANYIPRYRAKEITLKSRVPMGPFLLVWLCTGVPLGCII